MGQYRRGKWRFTRKCSNQWVNTAHLYVSLDCRTWKVENLAFERFFLAKPCSWCIRTVTSWCRVGTFGWCKTRGDRFSPSRWSGKVARRAGDLPGPLMDQTTVSSSFAPPKRPEPTSAPWRSIGRAQDHRCENPEQPPKNRSNGWASLYMHGSTPQRPHLGLWHITSPSHGSSYPLRRMRSSWLVETLPCGTGVKRCIVPVSLDAMALIIHLNTSPMDGTAPMVIFTTLHGDTGWLVAALFVWGFELDWSIFSWIQSYMCTHVCGTWYTHIYIS